MTMHLIPYGSSEAYLEEEQAGKRHTITAILPREEVEELYRRLVGDAWRPTHRHYKGGLYQKLFEANHTETTEELVVYRSEDGRFWCRPWSMFHGHVRQDDKDVPRFALIVTPREPQP